MWTTFPKQDMLDYSMHHVVSHEQDRPKYVMHHLCVARRARMFLLLLFLSMH